MAAEQPAPEGVETGEVLDTTNRPRRAQVRGQGNSVYSNVPETGRRVHDITKGTLLKVVTCENGIWITTADE
jgi:hypothetical protein